MSERLEAAAQLYDEAAKELDLAARHCEVAARHFREGAFPAARLTPGPLGATCSRPKRGSMSTLASTAADRV